MSKQLLILCGGKATRLKGINEKVPKCLLKIEGKSVLSHIVDGFITYFDSVIISFATGSKIFYEKDLESNFNNQSLSKLSLECDNLQRGTANAVKLHSTLDCQTLTVVNGDTLFNQYDDLFPKNVKTNECILSLCYQQKSRSSSLDIKSDCRYIKLHKDRYGEELNEEWVTNGLIIMGNYALKQFHSKTIYAGESLEDAIISMQDNASITYRLWRTKAKYLDIGTPDDYLNAEKKFRKL